MFEALEGPGSDETDGEERSPEGRPKGYEFMTGE
jgi:hypothetical protein